MAETASIISPDKKVLIPAKGAGCSLAESVTGYDLLQWKKANPDGLVVSYVNTTAEVKAYTDYCCTSSNALKVVQSLPKDKKILFVPDKNLGAYIQKVTGREMEIWNGDCCVHDKELDADMVLEKLEQYPEADALIHPGIFLLGRRSYSEPSAGIHVLHGRYYQARRKRSPKQQFIIATELETIHKLQQDNPTKEFIPIHPKTICGQMKKVTLESVWEALEKEQFEVRVPDELREKAWLPIQRMLEIG